MSKAITTIEGSGTMDFPCNWSTLSPDSVIEIGYLCKS